MRIGIIGSGRIGGTSARLFEAAGHDGLDRLDRKELTSSAYVVETLAGVHNPPISAPEAQRALRSA
jgi:predicted dinucleotide-binding enzyme